MQPTKYKNLYRTEGLFQYVYVEDNSKIEARNWNDLKFKLAIDGIKLQEKTDYKENNTIKNRRTISRKQYYEKAVKKQVRPPVRKHPFEKTVEKKVKPPARKHHFEKTVEKKARPPARKRSSNKKEYKKEPLKKNRDYIESEDDVNFGKIVRPGEIERWGPDNSERARKLRKDLIR